MFTALTSIALAFVYRLRGGGYVTLNHVIYTHLIWAAAMALAYFGQNGMDLAIVAVFFAAFVSMYVPHAYCQNMGQWPTPQKNWPSFFFPTYTLNAWMAAPLWRKALYDAGQMACVATVRGIIVFGAAAYFTSIPALIIGVLTIAIVQPIAYLIGNYMMFFNIPGCTKFSATWGEWFNGLGWGLAIAAATFS